MTPKPSPKLFHGPSRRAALSLVGLNPNVLHSTGWCTAEDIQDPSVAAVMDALFEGEARVERARIGRLGQDRP